MSSEGGLNTTKKRLLELIKLAIPEYGLVSGDWRNTMDKIYSPKTGLKLPAFSIRISPARVVPSFYGRVWKGTTAETGDVGLYSFSIHCFHSACNISGEEKYTHAHDIAERLMKYFGVQNWNSTTEPSAGDPHSDYSIGDVADMNARESEPKQGARRVCRVIIEGIMLVKRKD